MQCTIRMASFLNQDFSSIQLGKLCLNNYRMCHYFGSNLFSAERQYGKGVRTKHGHEGNCFRLPGRNLPSEKTKEVCG